MCLYVYSCKIAGRCISDQIVTNQSSKPCTVCAGYRGDQFLEKAREGACFKTSPHLLRRRWGRESSPPAALGPQSVLKDGFYFVFFRFSRELSGRPSVWALTISITLRQSITNSSLTICLGWRKAKASKCRSTTSRRMAGYQIRWVDSPDDFSNPHPPPGKIDINLFVVPLWVTSPSIEQLNWRFYRRGNFGFSFGICRAGAFARALYVWVDPVS